ncbi:uncharacterized protein CEXT_746271 [Caerostris extrusa]|uniref:Uncharacterized protein n=1 Tax=Caerostris extrusa TaxID=172846 RepID=A0AAV4X372_CAEEX|nr:uncharacterized protein CEXT_746271 [Caerostris extrusa]
MYKFGGELRDWLTFWNQFKSIHENKNLTNCDKFHYLVQSTKIKSEARELIESFPITDENYPLAIESLTERYGRKEQDESSALSASSESTRSKVLGLIWDKNLNALEIDTEYLEFDEREKITKREILSLVSPVFDPIGFLAPVMIQPKILLQATWKAKESWDEELNNEIKMNFFKMEKTIEILQEYKNSQMVRSEFRVNEIRWKFNPPLLSMVGRRVLKKLLERVLELYPEKGEITRLVKLRIEKGNILRPIQRLYPLELTPNYEQVVPETQKVLDL